MAQKVPPISKQELRLLRVPVFVGTLLAAGVLLGAIAYGIQLGAEQFFGFAGAAGITLSRVLTAIVVAGALGVAALMTSAVWVVPSGWLLVTRTYGQPKVYGKGNVLLKPVIELVVEWEENRIFRETVTDIASTTLDKFTVKFNVQITFRRMVGSEALTIYEVKRWYQSMLEAAESVAQNMIGTLSAAALNDPASTQFFLDEAKRQAALIYGEVLSFQIVDKIYPPEVQEMLSQAAAGLESGKAQNNIVASQLADLAAIDAELRRLYSKMPYAQRAQMARQILATAANTNVLPRLKGILPTFDTSTGDITGSAINNQK